MKIEHLLESKITRLMSTSNDGLQLARYLHRELNVLDNDDWDETSLEELIDLWINRTATLRRYKNVYVFTNGDGVWASLNFDSDGNNGNFTFLTPGRLVTRRVTDGPDLRGDLTSILGELSKIKIYVITTHGNLGLKTDYHKSVRYHHNKDDLQNKLDKPNLSKRIGAERSIPQRLWTYSPWVFGNALRYLRRKIEDGYELRGNYSELEDILREIIDLNGDSTKASKSEASKWFFLHEGQGLLLFWATYIIGPALTNVSLTTPYKDVELPPDFLTKICPALLRSVKRWIDICLIKVKD